MKQLLGAVIEELNESLREKEGDDSDESFEDDEKEGYD